MNKLLYARYLAIIGKQVFVVAMNGGLESATDADSNLRPIPLLPLLANGENESYSLVESHAWTAATMSSDLLSATHASGYPRRIGLIKLHVGDENNSYTLGSMQKFRVATVESDVAIWSDSESTAYTWSVLPLSEEFDIKSDIVATANAVSLLSTDGTLESCSYVDCRVCAFNDRPIGASAITDSYGNVTLHLYEPKHVPAIGEIKTYGDLNVNALDVANMLGDMASNTLGASTTSALNAIGIDGNETSSTYESATIHLWPLFDMDACGESTSYMDGGVNVPDALNTSGKDTFGSNFSANVRLLYLPIQTDDNLYIRQNFKGATLNGTDLEVI